MRNNNPEWWGTAFAALIFALATMAILGPIFGFWSIVAIIALLFTGGIIASRTGLSAATLRPAARLVQWIALIVVLWFVLMVGVFGIYPNDVINSLWSGGGYKSLLTRSTGSAGQVMLFSVVFIIVFGTVAKRQIMKESENARNVLVAALIVLALMTLLPTWTGGFSGSWGRLDTKLDQQGWRILVPDSWESRGTSNEDPVDTTGSATPPAPAASPAAPSATTVASMDPTYPIAGSRYATVGVPVQAWIDPQLVHTRPSGPVKYVSVDFPGIEFEDTWGVNTMSPSATRIWWKLPAGRYKVSPIGTSPVQFRWWQ